jgi:hypothetical protein
MQDNSADSTGNHGDIYVGDPIKLVSGLADIADAADANIAGVCVAVGQVADGAANNEAGAFNPDNLTRKYGNLTDSATETIWVYYAPAEDTIFEVQSDADLDEVVGATVQMNVVAATAHGSRTTGLSNVELTTGAGTDVTVIRVPEFPDNDSTLANTRYHVIFTDAAYRAAS